MTKPVNQKAVVFDLDETMGDFFKFSIFLDQIEDYIGKKITTKQKQEILALYPSVFRPGIFKVFNYLKTRKHRNIKVIIYTNNIGPKSWVMMIKNYIENSIDDNLFTKVIAGWRLWYHGKIQEHSRSTSEKTYEDLIRAAKLDENCKIIFFDDKWHPQMDNDKIKYVHLKEYQVNIPVKRLIKYFLDSKIGQKLIKNPEHFRHAIEKHTSWRKYQFSQKKFNLNMELKYTTSKILKPLKTFLKSTPYTRKKRSNQTRKTRKWGRK